ncbi:MAG: hypothetical protein J6M43_07305 [Neisseriaceae bacterium]|nr:hypothetical protein [Neisseriaceae bacterium]
MLWDLFLLLLGLCFIVDGIVSLKKLPIYKKQWQEITQQYELNKNGNPILMNLTIEDIKNIENLTQKNQKLETLRKTYFTQKIYQNDYKPLEKGVYNTLKILPFFAQLSMITGLFCIITPFVDLGKMPIDTINIDFFFPFLLIFGATGIIFPKGKNTPPEYTPNTFKGKLKLINHYFLNIDYAQRKKIQQMYQHEDEINFKEYVIFRSIMLFLFYMNTLYILIRWNIYD